jgi:cobaltochelatase CobN
VRDFLQAHNPSALQEIEARFTEALERGLWRPKRNHLREKLGIKA